MRSRTAAARSNSRFSAAASISRASSRWTSLALPPRKALAWSIKWLVLGGLDPADAGGGAALDLMQQAGAGAVGEDGVLAGAEEEDALHGGDGLVDGPGGGEGAVIAALSGAGAAMFGDLREGVVLGQHQPRVALVVAEDDVEAGFEALDEVGLEEKGFGLGVGGDDLHRDGLVDHAAQALGHAGGLRVVVDALLEVAGLADVEGVAACVEHAIHARALGHGEERALDHGHADEARGCGRGADVVQFRWHRR